MKTVRLQFEVYEAQVEKIDELMRKLGLKRRTELFNDALSFLSWAVKEREKGRIIVSMDEGKGTYKELVIPIWTLASG